MIDKTPSLEEQAAITRLKQGDLDGMEALVKRYQVQAVYTAYLIVGDLKLAEDIVQNAFLHAAQKIQQFDGRRSFGPWFLRSVVNAAIRAAEQQNRFVSLDEMEEEGSTALIDRMLDPEPGPEQIVETEETRRMVWEALGHLPAEQRAALIMRHFLEMDETEMEHRFDRPATTVRWWLRAARNRLRDGLQTLRQVDPPDEEKRHV